jgi:hypothetical protein
MGLELTGNPEEDTGGKAPTLLDRLTPDGGEYDHGRLNMKRQIMPIRPFICKMKVYRGTLIRGRVL